MSECPYKNNSMKKFSAFNRDNDTTQESTSNLKCPYGKGMISEEDLAEHPFRSVEEEKKEIMEENKDEDSEDENMPRGGCPIKNTGNFF